MIVGQLASVIFLYTFTKLKVVCIQANNVRTVL